MISKLSFGSIFSGGGLVEAGVADLFDLAFAVEHDGAIAEVYRTNFGDHVRVAAAQDVNVVTLPPVDVLWASPPCQAHSVARSKALAERDDAEVGIVVLDYVKATNPRYVFIENVEGYARHDVFRRIVDGLFRLGYWVRFDVLNAADFSVPQTRRRLILRAVRDSMIPMLPQPTPWQGWYSAIEDLIPTLPESRFAKWQLDRLPEGLMNTTLVDVQGQGAGLVCATDKPAMAITRSHGAAKYRAFIVDGKPANYAGALQVIDEAAPINTVTASQTRHPLRAFLVDDQTNSGGTSITTRNEDQPAMTTTTRSAGKVRAWLEQGRVVSMNPRALARFQSVPDSYVLPEKNALACKVIGNGVASRFARSIITATVEELHP